MCIVGEIDDSARSYLRKKVEEYMNRAETIKKMVLQQKEAGQFHEQVHIENNSTGHSYKTLFGRFLDEDVQFVLVEDPYIRSFHQVLLFSFVVDHIWFFSYCCTYKKVRFLCRCKLFKPILTWEHFVKTIKQILLIIFQCQNFLRLCELLVRSCSNLRYIELMTSRDPKTSHEQQQWFNNLANDLTRYRINLEVKFSETLHDRQIT